MNTDGDTIVKPLEHAPLVNSKTHLRRDISLKRLWNHRWWKLETKVKRTVPFTLSISPTDDVVSYLTQSNLSITPCMKRTSVTSIQTNTDSKNAWDVISEPNISASPPTGLHGFAVQFDNGTHNVESFSCKPTYPVKILNGVMWSVLLTLANFLHTGSGNNLINNNFPSGTWKECVRSFKAPKLQPVSRQSVDTEGFQLLSARIAKQCQRAWFGVIKVSLLQVLLRMSFIDRCIGKIFLTERRIPCHLRLMEIISRKTEISLI